MKPTVSNNTHQQVLDLRGGHSLREVAEKTGLPLGTVKTICHRSGAFKDNQALRKLFKLPDIQPSTGTSLAVPELPPQTAETGDEELDAVLWLREVIKTGQAALIEKAMLAAKRIKTPLKDLEKRYLDHLTARNPGNWTVAFQTFGFADLEGLAKSSIEKLTRRHEAISRFGSVDNLFEKTPGEQFCIDALAGLKFDPYKEQDNAKIDKRFMARPELLPHTLSDCLYERAHWSALYWLRRAAHPDAGDHWAEVDARDDFVFRSLARIRPKSKSEAVAVLRYLIDEECMDRSETEAILMNLVG